jgi:hypothetical protein
VIVFYLTLIYLISSHYGVVFFRWWNALHISLLKWKMTSEVAKSNRGLRFNESYFVNFPRTWRGLWLELYRKSKEPHHLRNLAVTTNLKNYCLCTTTTNSKSEVENFTVLAIVGSVEEMLVFLARVPAYSDFWQTKFENFIYEHQQVVLAILSKLLALGCLRQAMATLKSSPAESHLFILAALSTRGRQFYNFSVAQACSLSEHDQIGFIHLAFENKLTIFPFVKYFKRFTPEAQYQIRAGFSEHKWWLAQLLMAKSNDHIKIPASIAWYFSNSSNEPVPLVLLQSKPDFVIAA